MEVIARATVAVPPVSVTLDGLTVAVRPEGADAVTVTVPPKPLTDVMVTVEVALPPATIVRLLGMAVMVKSDTVTTKVTVTV